MPQTASHPAHAMAECGAVDAARALHRALMHGEHIGITLPERHDRGAGLHARPLLGDDELAALEIAPLEFRAGLGQQDRDL